MAKKAKKGRKMAAGGMTPGRGNEGMVPSGRPARKPGMGMGRPVGGPKRRPSMGMMPGRGNEGMMASSDGPMPMREPATVGMNIPGREPASVGLNIPGREPASIGMMKPDIGMMPGRGFKGASPISDMGPLGGLGAMRKRGMAQMANPGMGMMRPQVGIQSDTGLTPMPRGGMKGGGLARKGVGQALAKGGLVKGGGCASKGVKKARIV